MTTFSNRARTATVAVLAAGLAAALTYSVRPSAEARGLPTVRRVHASQITDLSDDRKLVGVAENVFFGQVVARLGQVTVESLPESQYSVLVTENIKGSLVGTVVVNQLGGYDERNNEVILWDEDHLIEPGTTYLFVTRSHPVRGVHTLVSGFGDLPAHGASEEDALRARFTAAYADQILRS